METKNSVNENKYNKKESQNNMTEQEIIEKAIKNVASDIATLEERIIVKLYKLSRIQVALDNICDEITPMDSTDKINGIKEVFEALKTSWGRAYDTIYPYCGNCRQYAVETLYEYLDDMLIDKFDSSNNGKQLPSMTLILLGIFRDEMDSETYYTIKDMVDIIKEKYPEYKNVLKRNKMNLFMDLCVEEGYFEEIRKEKQGMILQRYFKKTDKEYFDMNV